MDDEKRRSILLDTYLGHVWVPNLPLRCFARHEVDAKEFFHQHAQPINAGC